MKSLVVSAEQRDLEKKEREDLSVTEENVAELVSSLQGKDGNRFSIEAEADFDFATGLLLHAQERVKDIKKRSETVTRPLYQALEAFRDIYRPSLNGYKTVVDFLKPLIGEYTLKKSQEQEQAMRLIAEASANNDFDTAMNISSQVQRVPEKKGVSVTIGYSYEVLDWSKVPEQYRVKEVDERLMREYIKGFTGKPKDIPGIKFVEAAKVRKTRT